MTLRIAQSKDEHAQGNFNEGVYVVTRVGELDLDSDRFFTLKADPDRIAVVVENHGDMSVDIVFGDLASRQSSVSVWGKIGTREERHRRGMVDRATGELHFYANPGYVSPGHPCDFILKEVYLLKPKSEPTSP